VQNEQVLDEVVRARAPIRPESDLLLCSPDPPRGVME